MSHLGFPKPLIRNQVRHILIILSILLLSSPVIGDNHKGETLYGWGKCCDYKWMGFGEKDTQPKYQGQVKDGKPNGLGSLTYPDGSKYVGEYKDGKKHGQGTSTLSGSKIYEGKWKNGKFNGQGTFTYPNGTKYVGEYKKGKKWNVITYDKDGNIKYRIVDGWKK